MAVPSIARSRPRARISPLRLLLAVVFVLLGLSWFAIANYLPEGDILWTVSRGHGITVGDLPGVALLAIALWLAHPIRRLRWLLRQR